MGLKEKISEKGFMGENLNLMKMVNIWGRYKYIYIYIYKIA